jgi:hypothetical protein
MTVASEVSSVSHAGDGVTLAFAIPFRFLASSDISVVRRDADLSVTELTTGFSITGAGGAGGTCTFTIAPAADVDIIISRAPQILQPGDYTSNDAFPAEATETLLDRQAFISQYLHRLIQHCITVPYGDSLSGSGVELPGATTRANKYLAFGADGEMELADLTSSGVLTSSIIAGLLDSLVRTAQEIADGITPANGAYKPGDPRRYHTITVTDDEISGLYCRGFVPTYVDSDTFTLAGDRTAAFPDRTRIAVFNNSGVRTYCQVLSTSYSAPDTTVEVRTEIGNLPTSPVAVLNYVGVQLAHMNTVMVDYNAAQVFQIINKNTGSDAATQLFVGDFDAAGIAIIGTKSTTTPTPYYSLAPNNPISAITNGLAIPMVFVTHDRARLILDGDGLASQFTTSLIVQQTAENPNGSSTSTITIDGTAAAAMSHKVNGVEVGFSLVDATRVLFGATTNVPLHFYTNSLKRLGIPAGGISEYADDAAAAGGGLALGDMYRTGSVLKVRVA